MSKRGLLFAAASFIFVAGCNKQSSSGNGAEMSAQAERGERVFKMQCAICHNAHNAEPLHGPGMKGLYRRQELPSGVSLTDAHVKLTIKNGRNMMPPIPLDELQIEDVIAYLKTL
ncbi:MAG: hypothetical protein NVS9B15_01870 [Acidobacteriaceae bacterium]